MTLEAARSRTSHREEQMKLRTAAILMMTLLFVPGAVAQIRPAETSTASTEQSPVPENLPEKIEVEYRGGIYGFSKKEKGFITFDLINERMIFSDEEGKERFSIPYGAMKVVFPSQKKVRSGTGRAVGAIPLPGAGIAGLFMKKKKNYLVIQYEDPQVDVSVAANFLVDTGELLTNAVHAIGQSAEMARRCEAYVRRMTQ